VQTNERWYPCFLPDDYRRRLNRDRAQVESPAETTTFEPFDDEPSA
jgi:hypothetical protein